MVAIPESNESVSKEAYSNGKKTFETLVEIYNVVIAGLKEIEEQEPEKCAEWLGERSYPLSNKDMVELLYFMQYVIDAAKSEGLM